MAEWCDACGTYLVTWEVENIRLRAEVERLTEDLAALETAAREVLRLDLDEENLEYYEWEKLWSAATDHLRALVK
jgi:hypothetical protein